MNNKTYHYNDSVFNRKVKFIGIYAALIGTFVIAYILLANASILYISVFAVCLYTFWETFISISNPSDITISKDYITFTAFGRSHTFEWKDVYSFKCKEFYMDKKIFLRINRAGLLKGRYWISCRYFNDSDELFNFFIQKENELHPDTVKARSRKNDNK